VLSTTNKGDLVAQYREPYEPRFRLVSTSPLSAKVSKVAGVDVPSEFICNLLVVSDEGRTIHHKLIEEHPTFSVSMIIRVTKSGKPEMTNVEVRGDTHRRSVPMGLEFRESHLVDTKPLTPWQLRFVADYRGLLMKRAIYEVAERWTFTKKEKKVSWHYPITSDKKLKDAEVLRLRKSVESKINEKINDDFLEEVARRYLAHQKSGLDPIKELENDYPDRSHRTIQRWASKARDLGFLSKTTPGKVSRETKYERGKNGNTKKAKSRKKRNRLHR